WPGNVRELQNVVERVLVLATGPALEIDAELIGAGRSGAREPIAPAVPAPTGGRAPGDVLKGIAVGHGRAALAPTGRVIEGPRGAARTLGLHPNTLRSRIEKLGIRRSGSEVS